MEEISKLIKNLLQPIIMDAVTEAMAAAEMQQPKEDKRYTRQQVCERWAITLPTLNNYVKAGRLAPIKIGRRVLFSESEIQKAESAGIGKYHRFYNK